MCSKHKADIKRFKADETSIRRIINEWDPIPGSPVDEYDCLVHHILSAMHHGSTEAELAQLVKSEMINHFDVDVADVIIEKVIRNILNLIELNKR